MVALLMDHTTSDDWQLLLPDSPRYVQQSAVTSQYSTQLERIGSAPQVVCMLNVIPLGLVSLQYVIVCLDLEVLIVLI